MLSDHYPLAFASEYNWVIAGLIFLMGVTIRHFFNTMHAQGQAVVDLGGDGDPVHHHHVVSTAPMLPKPSRNPRPDPSPLPNRPWSTPRLFGLWRGHGPVQHATPASRAMTASPRPGDLAGTPDDITRAAAKSISGRA